MFDYFYGAQSDQFSFYRVPKVKAAKKAFDELGVKKIPKVKDLSAEYAQILADKKRMYAEYRHVRDEVQELLIAQRNIATLYADDHSDEENQKKKPTKDR